MAHRAGGLGHLAGHLAAHEDEEVELLGRGEGADVAVKAPRLVAELPHLAEDRDAATLAGHGAEDLECGRDGAGARVVGVVDHAGLARGGHDLEAHVGLAHGADGVDRGVAVGTEAVGDGHGEQEVGDDMAPGDAQGDVAVPAVGEGEAEARHALVVEGDVAAADGEVPRGADAPDVDARGLGEA